ncbi:uncharacterized protein Upf3 [Epargyreus clarus]|uniref:uncharacterized protein Upf3 n=1 Tax=Epargyreus clarus TaxID=520877 RepID=UPI003C2B04C7
MTEDLDSKDSQSDSGSKTFINKSKDKKAKAHRPLTKIILRRLPPTMTEEAFLEQVSPIPDHDHFYFAKADPTLGNNMFSRAYINFVNVDDIYLFRDKFDGYVFLDEKGLEYVGIVEYAPFQRVPKKKKKKDPKCGTIESDPVYQEFIENLNKDQESENQPKLEYSYPISDGNDKKAQSTPLLDYLASRKQDKRSRDERRRRENDKRKMRIERKTKDGFIKEEEEIMEIDIKKVKPREWEREKPSIDLKDDVKSDIKDGTVFESKSYKDQRKPSTSASVIPDKRKKTELDKKDSTFKDEENEDDKGFKKDKRDKFKDSPREQKSKKYSDTRKERIKQADIAKTEKQAAISKIMSSEGKPKSLNHDDIKPFTQLPQVKTDDLAKIIESMDRKVKLEENHSDAKSIKVTNDDSIKASTSKVERKTDAIVSKIRRESAESDDTTVSEDLELRRQRSVEERGKSLEREGSEEKDKTDSDRRTERRIRNKDRPSLPIYQPGMGKFSKQRLAKEKDIIPSTSATARTVSDSEKRDT